MTRATCPGELRPGNASRRRRLLTAGRPGVETAGVAAKRLTLLLGVVAALAAAVRTAAALLRPAWHDEYFTAWAAGLRPGDLLAALRLDSGPPLPYLLARLVGALGVAPLAAARSVSVAAGTLAVVVAARAAGRAGGARAGLWCAALLAFHPLAVAWSSEGRGYALLLLAAALAWERLESLGETGRGATGLALAVALGCWSHALGLVLAAAAAAATLALPRRERQAGLLGVGAGMASHLPWLPIAMAQPPAATAWMGAAWQALSPLERAFAPVRLLPSAAPFAASLDVPSLPLAAQVGAAAAAIVLLVSARPAPRAAVLAAVPAFGLAALAWIGMPYLFPGRSEALYLAPSLGLLAAAAACSRAAWTARIAGGVLVAAAAATSAAAIASWGAAPPAGEMRLAGEIRRQLPNGGTVVVGGYWRLGISYHLGGAAERWHLVNAPAAAAAHPGWYDDTVDRMRPGELDSLAERLTRAAAARTGAAIVVAPGLATARPLESLARRLGLQETLRTPGAVLWTTPPAR